MDDKSLLIISQVAAKAAAEICQGKGMDAVTGGDYIAASELIFADILDHAGLMVNPSKDPAQAAEDIVAAAFTAPGGETPARVDQDDIPIGSPIPTQGASGHVPSAPKTITEKSSKIDMLEDAIFHNPNDWKFWDTEKSTVNGGKSPDFTHESLKNSKGYALGVFMVDTQYGKNTAPEWAFIEKGCQKQYAALLASGKVKA